MASLEPSADAPAGADAPAALTPRLRRIALMLARFNVQQLRRLYETFDRDIMLAILLGEIALYNLTGPAQEAGVRPENDDGSCPLRPCNAYSIAVSTGIPRETVRRKVVRLSEQGWLKRQPNGLVLTEKALDHFGQLFVSRDLRELLDAADRIRRLQGA
jgi:hypothetical protein